MYSKKESLEMTFIISLKICKRTKILLKAARLKYKTKIERKTCPIYIKDTTI